MLTSRNVTTSSKEIDLRRDGDGNTDDKIRCYEVNILFLNIDVFEINNFLRTRPNRGARGRPRNVSPESCQGTCTSVLANQI